MPNQDVIDAVERLGIVYELISIDPADADTLVFCEKYGYPLEESGNTLVVASKKEPKQFAACVVLAHTQLDVNKRVRKLMGVSKSSFATAEEMQTTAGMQVGGVTKSNIRRVRRKRQSQNGLGTDGCPYRDILSRFYTVTVRFVTP
jgi:prolyl-tRNA editing enzyme YbaK/EbsC (Cys-tRNA(Pro) deacylase)